MNTNNNNDWPDLDDWPIIVNGNRNIQIHKNPFDTGFCLCLYNPLGMGPAKVYSSYTGNADSESIKEALNKNKDHYEKMISHFYKFLENIPEKTDGDYDNIKSLLNQFWELFFKSVIDHASEIFITNIRNEEPLRYKDIEENNELQNELQNRET